MKVPTLNLLPEVLPENVNFLMVSRLFVFIPLTVTCLLFLWLDNFTFYLLVAYSLSVLIFFVGVSQVGSLLPLRSVKLLLLVHLIFELAMEAAIVNHSGGIDSPFSLFFVVSIASAGLLYQLKASVMAAVVGGFFYLSGVLGSFLGRAIAFPSFSNLTGLYGRSLGDFCTLVLNILLFLVVAFNVGYLAGKLHRKAEEVSLFPGGMKNRGW